VGETHLHAGGLHGVHLRRGLIERGHLGWRAFWIDFTLNGLLIAASIGVLFVAVRYAE
jgi:hypothetical protein